MLFLVEFNVGMFVVEINIPMSVLNVGILTKFWKLVGNKAIYQE